MKSAGLWLLFFCTITVCTAEEGQSRWRVGAHVNWVGQENLNQEGYEWQPAFGLEAGWEWARWTFGLQWRRFKWDSTMGNYAIEGRADRYSLVVRQNWQRESRWRCWVQGDVGSEIATVRTRQGVGAQSLESEPELILGVGLGVGWTLLPGWQTELVALTHKAQTRSPLEVSASASLIKLF